MPRHSTSFSPGRFELIELRHRFRKRCVYCRRVTVLPPRQCGQRLTRTTATRDHIITQAAGGSDGPENLVLACNECNHDRASMPFEMFMARKRAEIDRARASIAQSRAGMAGAP